MWDKLALILLIIGGVNWGLVGVFEFDLVAWLFGGCGVFHQPCHLYSCGDRRTVVHDLPVPAGGADRAGNRKAKIAFSTGNG